MTFDYLEDGVRKSKTVAPVTFETNCEVLCIGVGAAGAYAAISAAREGCDVIAIEKDNNIGGMPINGKVTFFYYGEEGGTYEETECRAKALDKCFYGGDKHIEARQTVLAEMLTEKGVKLICGATVLGIYIDEFSVMGAMVWHNGKCFDIGCKMLIDATSDGHIVHMCPIRTYFGRVTDGKTVPFTNRTDHITADGKYTHCNGDDGYCDQYEPWSFSKKILRAHANKLKFVRPANGNRMLSVATSVGVREGIRYEGEETLSYRDIISASDPEKVLFYARSDLDKHGHDLAMDEVEYQNWWVLSNLSTVVARIPVPLGAVVPKGLKGIVTAGRCLSVDSYASSAVRMNRDMFRMGECVGIASAMAVKGNTSFTNIDYSEYLAKTEKYGCMNGRYTDRFAFDHPSKNGFYRPITFDLTDEQIISILSTESPGEAIYACYRSDGKIAEKLIPCLDSSDRAFALHCAIALGIMGRREGISVLREAVKSRGTEIFKGCRRSNQYKSAAAICLIGRIGDKNDIELLKPIVFDSSERKKNFYAEPNDVLAFYTDTCRFCFYQHFTHAVMALVKLTARYGGSEELKSELSELFYGESGNSIISFVSDGKPTGAIGEEMSDFMKNVLKML